jgi:hypothetical protein
MSVHGIVHTKQPSDCARAGRGDEFVIKPDVTKPQAESFRVLRSASEAPSTPAPKNRSTDIVSI